MLFHEVALLVYFPAQGCDNNIFPMPINKLSILWLEREIAISWCSTTNKTFYLLSVSITLLSLDFVGEAVFPVSVMWCICEQRAWCMELSQAPGVESSALEIALKMNFLADGDAYQQMLIWFGYRPVCISQSGTSFFKMEKKIKIGDERGKRGQLS